VGAESPFLDHLYLIRYVKRRNARLTVVEIKKLPAAFYCTPAGREPVREWLKALDEADRRTVGQDICHRRVRLAGRNAGLRFARQRLV
jgi:hypothetical protein